MKLMAMDRIFVPDTTISKRSLFLLAGGQAVAAVIFWIACSGGVLPGPAAVLNAFGELWMHEGLGKELASSLLLNIEALLVATVLSLTLAYLSVTPFFRPLAFYVAKGRFLGLVGLTFPFTLMAGGGHSLKVMLLAFGMTVFFVTSMVDAIVTIPQAEFDYARTLRMGGWRGIYEVVILGKADVAFDIVRQIAAVGWTMLTMVEGLVRSEGGVGVLLLNENRHFQLDRVFAIQFSILFLGLMQDWLIGIFKGWICPYCGMERREGEEA